MKTKKYPKNLIFLDFDGVVTSKKEGGYLYHEVKDYTFDREIIGRLKKLCDETNAKIVITSNWRKFEKGQTFNFNGKVIENPLPSLRKALDGYIFDTLPPERHIRKSECTILWFEDNYFKGNFVIFDDDLREGFQDYPQFKSHFILCNPEFGITDEFCVLTKKIFGII